MAKQKAQNNPVEETSSNPEGETQPNTTQSKRKSVSFKVIIWTLVLLLFTGIASYFITWLVLPRLSNVPVPDEDEIVSVQYIDDIDLTLDTPAPADTIEPPTTEIKPISEPAPEITSENETAKDTPQPNVVEQEMALPEAQSPVMAKITPDETKAQPHSSQISLLKLLQLYEAFQKGKECRGLLEELILSSKNDPRIEKSLMNLLHICLENPMPQQLQQAFYKDKKRAILRILQNENPNITAYFKMIPYTLLDISKKDPASNEPMDVFYRIQNAVEANQFSQVLELIAKLPENAQPALYDLQQCALREETIYRTLQDLIQTLIPGSEK